MENYEKAKTAWTSAKEEDVIWAKNLYEAAKDLVAAMTVKAQQGENRNEALKQAKAAAERATAAVAQAEMRAGMIAGNAEMATQRAEATQNDATRAKSAKDEAQRLVAEAKNQTSKRGQVQSADDAAPRAQGAATMAQLAMHGFSELPSEADVCIAFLADKTVVRSDPSAPAPDGIDDYDPTKDPNRGTKGASVDPNIGDLFQQQPGGKPQDTTGTVSSAPPVPIPGEPPPAGGDKGPTTTSSVPPPAQPGVGYPCCDPSGNLYYSQVPCPGSEKPLVPTLTPPSGKTPEKDSGRMQQPIGNTAKIDCLKQKGYHWHADTQMCCNEKHGKQGQKSGGH